VRERRVLVAGGGLAGLAAAIAASSEGACVTLAEAGLFGRDKVCGEFLSPEVVADLDALGCGDAPHELGAVPVRSVALFGAGDRRIDLSLPGAPGLCVTRRALEGRLAASARARGVALLERCPVRALVARRDGGWGYRAGEAEGEAEAIVGAFGKRSPLDAELHLPRARAPEPFSAAKAYFAASPAALEADVELFLVPGGYVGLNPVEGGRVGLCALFAGPPTRSFDALRDRFGRSPALAARLDRLGAPEGPVHGLAKFGFGYQGLATRAGPGGSLALFAGDAARMMPSFTGDGMAVALRSGRLAAASLGDDDPARGYAARYEREFRRRFAVANALHGAFLSPWVFGVVAPLVRRWPAMAERLVSWTRGAA
jgi:flavin-dependent dehydrogenase